MKMKHGIFVLTVLMSVYSLALALPPGMTAKPAATAGLDTETMIDVNNLQMFVTNQGGYAEDWGLLLETQQNDGLYYPAGTDKTVLFSAGIWIGGLVGGDIRLAVGAFDTPEYYQGPADANGVAQPDRERYKVYKIRKDSTIWLDPNKTGIETNDGTPYTRLDSARHFNDYTLWVDSAVLDGAPLDDLGNPLLIGDQTLWTVYNDGGTHTYNAYGGGTDSLGIEMQATFWGYDLPGALGNTIFAKWIIIHKGADQIDSTFVSLWADPDLGGASDDFVGCDTQLSLGYCYNSSNNDNVYGSTPPAIGFDFLQGPIVRRGDPIYPDAIFDTAMVILNTGDTIPEAIKLGMSSFNKYINGTDPDVPEQGYGYMKGFNAVEDCPTCPYIDPFTGQPTKFFGAGDPVSPGEADWIDTNPADRRYMLSTGPFTFYPGDTQVVVAAFVVGQASDRLTAVTALKFFDQLAQYAYDVNFVIPSPPPRPVVDAKAYDRRITLTWTTRSEVEYFEPKHDFEGYVIYQGETISGPWKRVATFDLNNTFGVLFDDVLDPDLGAVVNIPVAFGSDAGIQRYFEINEDYISGGRLSNGRDYYFAVTAYSFSTDPSVPGGLKVLENRIQAITITPQDDSPGSDWSTTGTEVSYVRIDPTEKASTDQVTVEVVDEMEVTGHNYEIRFLPIYPDTIPDNGGVIIVWPDTTDLLSDGALVDIHQYWELWDVTTGTRLLEKQWNKSGDDNYLIVDGLLIKVIGAHRIEFQGLFYFDNNPAHGPALAGVNWGGAFFGGSTDYGFNFWGGYYDYTDPLYYPDSFTTIEMRFVDDVPKMRPPTGQRAYNYCRGCDPNYGYQGYFTTPFIAWDVGNDRQVNVAFVEWNASDVYDSTWGPDATGSGGREYIFPLKSEYDGDDPADAGTGSIDYTTEDFFDGSNYDFLYGAWWTLAAEDAVIDSGDVLQFLFANPSDTNDVYAFTTTAAVTGDQQLAESALDDIRVVPNPYYAYSAYEIDQFDRQVRFLSVPENFTIRIFNLAGDMVRKLESDDLSVKQPGQSWAKWNLATDQGLPIASGVYIWYIETDVGTKYGKMAVFPEVEQLLTY